MRATSGRPSLLRTQLALLVLALLASLVFGGWNLWRKNVYYDALHLVAAEKVAEAVIRRIDTCEPEVNAFWIRDAAMSSIAFVIFLVVCTVSVTRN